LTGIVAAGGSAALNDEINRLETKAQALLKDLYSALTPWQKAMVARHPLRPHFKDYITGLIEDFSPLAGDRAFGEDEAIVGGLGRFKGQSVCIIGQEKVGTRKAVSVIISAWRCPRAIAKRSV